MMVIPAPQEFTGYVFTFKVTGLLTAKIGKGHLYRQMGIKR